MVNVALFLPVLILSSRWPGAHPNEGQGTSPEISFEQKRLAHLPNDSTLGLCVFGADGRRVAYEILESTGGKVFVNGIGGELFEGPSGASRLRFSSDGRRLAYVAGRSGQMCVVIDGAKGKSYSRILDLNFSADGLRVFYLAIEIGARDKAMIIVDGKQEVAFDPIAGSIQFSPDGKRLAYVGRDKGRQCVVVDGIKESPYDAVGPISFSSDGRTVGYVARTGTLWTPVLNGKEGGSFGSISPTISFSAEPPKWGYVASLNQEGSVVLDGAVTFRFSAQKVGPLFLSRNGGNYAFPLMEPSGQQSVIYDGMKHKAFDGISSVTLSPTGKRIAYQGIKRGNPPKVSAVIDGGQGSEFDRIWGIQFSADDAHSAYLARTGKQYVLVLDGKAGTAIEGDPNFDSLFETGQIAFSQDGKRLAYFIHKITSGGSVVVNGKEEQTVSSLWTPLIFNSDGTRLAFGASVGPELWWYALKLN